MNSSNAQSNNMDKDEATGIQQPIFQKYANSNTNTNFNPNPNPQLNPMMNKQEQFNNPQNHENHVLDSFSGLDGAKNNDQANQNSLKEQNQPKKEIGETNSEIKNEFSVFENTNNQGDSPPEQNNANQNNTNIQNEQSQQNSNINQTGEYNRGMSKVLESNPNPMIEHENDAKLNEQNNGSNDINAGQNNQNILMNNSNINQNDQNLNIPLNSSQFKKGDSNNNDSNKNNNFENNNINVNQMNNNNQINNPNNNHQMIMSNPMINNSKDNSQQNNPMNINDSMNMNNPMDMNNQMNMNNPIDMSNSMNKNNQMFNNMMNPLQNAFLNNQMNMPNDNNNNNNTFNNNNQMNIPNNNNQMNMSNSNINNQMNMPNNSNNNNQMNMSNSNINNQMNMPNNSNNNNQMNMPINSNNNNNQMNMSNNNPNNQMNMSNNSNNNPNNQMNNNPMGQMNNNNINQNPNNQMPNMNMNQNNNSNNLMPQTKSILEGNNNNNINSNNNQNIPAKSQAPNQNEPYSFSRYKAASRTTLKNLGDTSYLNSVLQLLGTSRSLSTYFINPKNTKFFVDNMNSAPLAFVLHRLFTHFYPYPEKKVPEVYEPETLLTILGSKNKIYASTNRRNPNDLILFILNYLHKEINFIKTQYITSDTYTNKQKAISEFFENYYKSNKSIISLNFIWFEIKSQRCTRCKTEFFSLRNYETLDLDLSYFYSMNYNQALTITKCLEFQRYKQQKSFCKKCQGYNMMMNITNGIISLPNYLVFSLNRESSNNNINLKSVPFLVEEVIDLSNFIELNESFSRYELQGIVSISWQENKYVCFGKSPVDHKWYLYNDEKCFNGDINAVLDLNNNNKGYIPCILLYKAINKSK